MRWMAFVLLLGVPAFGCGDDDGAADAGADAGPRDSGGIDAPPSDERLEIGTGLTDFEDVPEGGEIELVMGAQGGWHIDIATKLYGMDPMDLNLRMQGFDTETNEAITIVVERVLTTRRVRDEGDHYLRLGDQLVFMVEDGSQAVGRSVRVEVDATPDGGTPVHAEKIVRVIDLIP